MPRRRAPEADLDHLGEYFARHASQLEVLQLRPRFDLGLATRLRDQEDRARGVALGEAGERPARLWQPLWGCPDDMGHRAGAELRYPVGCLPRTQPPQLTIDIGDDAH